MIFSVKAELSPEVAYEFKNIYIFVFMNQPNKKTYVVPSCQDILLVSESGILSGATPSASTKDISYEDI